MRNHDGMVVLVTGGSTGFGHASAELLAVGGGRVAVNSSDPAEADAAAATIIANGGRDRFSRGCL